MPSWKRDHYFSGKPLPSNGEPHADTSANGAQSDTASGTSVAMPEEMSAPHRQLIRRVALGFTLVGVGVVLGVWQAPEAPKDVRRALGQSEKTITEQDQRIDELNRLLQSVQEHGIGSGHLKPEDRQRHEVQGRRYVQTLRQAGAQGAADLMTWFIGRWNTLLDNPQPDDRVTRRAATLSLLVGGMAHNMHPGDFVAWQAEFLDTKWLAELHFDSDGDGLPTRRTARNTLDGFANVSVCHIAMAMNQATTDAQVLVMPELKCDRPEARMSVFLQGETFDAALTNLREALREQGYLVKERQERGVRLILVGMKPH